MDATTENPDKGLGILTAIGQIPTGFLLPLIMFLVNKSNPAKQWLTDVAREALNFQITFIIAYVVLMILGFVAGATQIGILGAIVGILFLVLWLAYLVFAIIATVQAASNKVYHYPFILRLIK